MVLFRDYEKWGRVACLRKHGLLRGEVGSQGCRTLCCDSFPPTFFVLVWATLCKSGLTLDSVQGSLLAGLWIEPRSSTWKAANALPTVLFCLFPVQSSENWCHFEHYLKFIRFFSFSTIFFLSQRGACCLGCLLGSNCLLSLSLRREDDSSEPPDACRIHGHLYVNKVAGNFHITVGKYVLSLHWRCSVVAGEEVGSLLMKLVLPAIGWLPSVSHTWEDILISVLA